MTSPLIVVQPVQLIDAMLISTDVPEADHPVYDGGTTYALGARVILTTGVHRIYESLQSGNLGKPPQTSPAHWVEVGPTNRWALFDGSNSTQTAKSTSMTYTLRPGSGVNALAALNLVGATSMRVRVTHPDLGTIYDRTVDVASLPPAPGWWEWFFGLRTAPPLAVLTDLPGIPGTDVIVDLAGTTELAIGVLLVGGQRPVGLGVLQGARIGITDYSRRETNQFGDVVLQQRASAKRASFTVPVLRQHVTETSEFLNALRSVPTLYIGSAEYAGTVIFGFFKNFEVSIAYRVVSECSLDIEGLT